MGARQWSHRPVKLIRTYREVADDMQRRIERGEYLPGWDLPPYAELARHYRVGISVAQRAVRLLRDQGLATGVRGLGVHVPYR
jgi:DNA-binding GntR family transcriptional regulator